jgi:hypothetical protein
MRPATAYLVGVLLALLVSAGASATVAGATSGRQALTVYAVATKAAFIDHADDRARGNLKNPFNADVKALTPTKEKEKGGGPYPGDEALLAFKLYSDAHLKKSIGTAVYSCTYNFAKQALCRADFDLKGGSLLASGPVDFNSTHFSLAVTGGTGKYNGAQGEVTEGAGAAPTTANTHRLDFDLG